MKDHKEKGSEPTKFPEVFPTHTTHAPELKSQLSQPYLLPEGVINICIDEGLYEYSREVFVYLRDVESALPSDFLGSGSITSNMRKILVDWLIQVQHHLKLTQLDLWLIFVVTFSFFSGQGAQKHQLRSSPFCGSRITGRQGRWSSGKLFECKE